jgi:cell volume regulation protein A
MAVFLTMTCIGLLTRKIAFGPELLMMFILNMGIGLLIGFIMAKVSITLINRIKLEYEGLYPVLTIALILYTYAITTLANGNGFLAVYLLGLLMSKDVFVQKRSIVRFYEGIAWLMQIIMFLTLGLLVFPSRIVPVIGPGLLIACILIFLARPTAVFLSLMPFKFSLPEKTMIAWVGLRGAVPIILATFPLLAGIEEAQTIFNIVFFVVLTSVLVQGTSVPVLSKWLKVTSPLDEKKRYPIEFEHSHGINATLTDIIIPFNSAVVGRTIAQLNIPPNTLIVLISRGEEFLVPNGSTLLEEGDVLLVLANDEDLRQIQSEVKVFKPEEK